MRDAAAASPRRRVRVEDRAKGKVNVEVEYTVSIELQSRNFKCSPVKGTAVNAALSGSGCCFKFVLGIMKIRCTTLHIHSECECYSNFSARMSVCLASN